MSTPAAVGDALERLLVPLLGALERMVWVQRYLYPPLAPRLAEVLAPQHEALAAPLAALREHAWPEELAFVRERLDAAAQQALEMLDAFMTAARESADP